MCSHTGTFKAEQKETFFSSFIFSSLAHGKERELCVFSLKLAHVLVTSQGLCFRASAVGFQILGSTNPFGHFELWIFFQDLIHKGFKASELSSVGQSLLNFNLNASLGPLEFVRGTNATHDLFF